MFSYFMTLFYHICIDFARGLIYAAIANRLSGVSKECLKIFDLERFYKTSQVLIAAKAIDLFYAMLEMQGVKMVQYYKIDGNFEKHYGYFIVE